MTKFGIVWLVAMWILVAVIISCKSSVQEDSKVSPSRNFNKLEALEKKWLEWQEENPCEVFQNFLDNPNECNLHHLENSPTHEGIIYLAEDGTVRWKVWLKETE